MIQTLLGFLAGAGVLIVVAIILVAFFVASAFTLWAARIVKVENATYGKALLATLLGSLAGGAVAVVLGFVPAVGPVLGIIGAGLSIRWWSRRYSAPAMARACSSLCWPRSWLAWLRQESYCCW